MKKGKLVLLSICLGGAASAQGGEVPTGLKVVPIRSEDAVVVDQAFGEVSKPQQLNPERQQRKENFGKVVSIEAKVFRVEPIPGYRNFGEWVSSQRRNCPKKGPSGSTPPSTPSGGGGDSSSTP